ncbi:MULTISPECIES: hypothetical protein [unclassified Moorena]|nr:MULTISPECIES: hypothetical protein [unclassified Moorena]
MERLYFYAIDLWSRFAIAILYAIAILVYLFFLYNINLYLSSFT